MTHAQLASTLKQAGGRGPQREDIDSLSDILLLLRHGERLDHVDRTCKESDPPLSPSGRLQALETALFFRRLQRDNKIETRLKGLISIFISSPFCRCIETAVIINIVGFGGSLPLFINPLLSDWLQTKVFRAVPTLRGHYTCEESADGEDGNNIFYAPDIVSLQGDISLFLENYSQDSTFLETNSIQPNVAKEWTHQLASWCKAHPALPVWTSSPVRSLLQIGIKALSEEQIDKHLVCQRRLGEEEKDKKERITERNKRRYNSCGISFPESRKELLQRCQEFISVHFNANEPFRQCCCSIPSLVIEAIKQEKKKALPTNWKAACELERGFVNSGSKSSSSSSHSLLPPMHVLSVTHADVVSGILESVCPKQCSSKSASVPYCSMTTLRRRNNFYTIDATEKDTCKARRRKAFPKTKSKSESHREPSTVQVLREIDINPLTSASLDWTLEGFGSLEALTTKIILRYC